MDATPPAAAPASAPGVALTGISSMATRQLLSELVAEFEQRSSHRVAIESVGGVDAARRVQGGEVFDFVVLAADAVDKLIAGGHLQPGSRVDLAKSPVAVAVRAGATRPDIGTAAALRAAVLAAGSICFSTGPSGTHLTQLFERWGIADAVAGRMVQAPAGVPVGALLASGQVELGFQQHSELMHLPGVDVLGLLPGDSAFVTTFSLALGLAVQRGSARHRAVGEMLAYFASPEAAETRRRHGMAPA
jgi:molybdate transport system substrate-binding protein